MEHTYTVSELKQLVRESNGDFKPKFGNGVDADNKKNNKEAVNAMMKDAKVSNYIQATALGQSLGKGKLNRGNF